MKGKHKIQHWLFKEEPSHYSLDDLEKESRTVWDGVTNNLALKNLRQAKVGDCVLFYHTGKEKAVVAEMKIVSEPYLSQEAGMDVVDVELVRRLKPVTLKELKNEPAMQESDLVRLPRLSIVPLTLKQWNRILDLSQKKEIE